MASVSSNRHYCRPPFMPFHLVAVIPRWPLLDEVFAGFSENAIGGPVFSAYGVCLHC